MSLNNISEVPLPSNQPDGRTSNQDFDNWLIGELGLANEDCGKAKLAGKKTRPVGQCVRNERILKLLTGDARSIKAFGRVAKHPGDVDTKLTFLAARIRGTKAIAEGSGGNLIERLFAALLREAGRNDDDLFADIILNCTDHRNPTVRQWARIAAGQLAVNDCEQTKNIDPILDPHNLEESSGQKSGVSPLPESRAVDICPQPVVPGPISGLAPLVPPKTDSSKPRPPDIGAPFFGGTFRVRDTGLDGDAYQLIEKHLKEKRLTGGLTIINLCAESEKKYFTLVLYGESATIVDPFPMRKKRNRWFEPKKLVCEIHTPSPFLIEFADNLRKCFALDPSIVNYRSTECKKPELIAGGGNLAVVMTDRGPRSPEESFGRKLADWLMQNGKHCDFDSDFQERVCDFIRNRENTTEIAIASKRRYRAVRAPSPQELNEFYVRSSLGLRRTQISRPELVHKGVTRLDFDQSSGEYIFSIPLQSMLGEHFLVENRKLYRDKVNLSIIDAFYELRSGKNIREYYTVMLFNSTAIIINYSNNYVEEKNQLKIEKYFENLLKNYIKDGRDFTFVTVPSFETGDFSGRMVLGNRPEKCESDPLTLKDQERSILPLQKEWLEKLPPDTGLNGARFFSYVQARHKRGGLDGGHLTALKVFQDYHRLIFDERREQISGRSTEEKDQNWLDNEIKHYIALSEHVQQVIS